MNVFLPYPDFEKSVACLDDLRLNRQAIECRIIMDSLTGRLPGGWLKNPAVYMWKGYVAAINDYYNLCLEEWTRRGHKNKILKPRYVPPTYRLPPWMGDKEFHKRHRINLLTKDYEHFKQFGWKEKPDPTLGPLWPVSKPTRRKPKGRKS